MMNIRSANREDAASVAGLHKQALNESFLGSLDPDFLKLIYASLAGYDQGLLLVAEEKGGIVGFVSGAAKTGDFFKYFLKRNSDKAAMCLLSALFRRGVIKKILETFKYSKKDLDVSMPSAELLSMAVSREYEGKGVARQLFEAFAEEFRQKGVNEFKIVAGNKLARANGFYQKMGCVKMGEIEVHKDARSSVYIYKKMQTKQ